jgi:hypothetical protein
MKTRIAAFLDFVALGVVAVTILWGIVLVTVASGWLREGRAA